MNGDGMLPSVNTFCATYSSNKAKASRLLFAWLSDDAMREQLYADMIRNKTILRFESRALLDDGLSDDENDPKSFRQDAYLIVHPDHVEQAYREASSAPIGRQAWSHTPYNNLGGTFMLALDEPESSDRIKKHPFLSHDRQRDYCYALLMAIEPDFDAIATVAFKAGALLPLKQRAFDLADLAEMVSVNYVALLFGFSQADLPMLKRTAQKIGNGLMYVNAGRHFLTDPTAIALAKQALAELTQRAAELVDLYDCRVDKEQEDKWKDLKKEFDDLRKYWFDGRETDCGTKQQRLKEFTPVMQRMADDSGEFSTTEKALMVAGLVSGTITNMRAAVCITVRQFFELSADNLEAVRKIAVDAWVASQDAYWDEKYATAFRALVEEALRLNPPPPFVPRRAARDFPVPGAVVSPAAAGGLPTDTIPKDGQLVIAVGGGSWSDLNLSADDLRNNKARRFNMNARASGKIEFPTYSTPEKRACPFSKIFGGAPELKSESERAEYLHSCIGKNLAMYSISHTVRQLMLLPGLTQALDPRTAQPHGLIKRAGFICERYPLEYEREKVLRQSPLQTVLPVKNPVSEHAAAIRQVLQFGAPFIEKVLREARHVHFASFMFLDNDSKLALFTAYDGDFDGYIGHFAHEFGPLFDRFFSHIEGGPPAPIAEHAFEFVQFLRRYQQPAVGGLFFSAYQQAQVDQITWQFNANRKYDFFTLEGGR